MVVTKDSLIGKMELYKLISLAFYYPSSTFFDKLKSKEYYENFKNALIRSNLEINDDIMYDWSKILILDGISFDKYESQYLLDFETNIPQSSCSLYERHYSKNPNTAQILLELKAFYKTFDLQKSSEFNDTEDHLIYQLEFMHFLSFKEIQASEAGLERLPYVKCKLDFLERHLLKWIPDFVNKTYKNVKSDFHRLLALMSKRLIELDYAAVKTELNVN